MKVLCYQLIHDMRNTHNLILIESQYQGARRG